MSSREFVDPVHKNVDVLTFSVASRVILDMNIAKGIEVKRFGKTLEYFACNEVILSAGAIGSPQGLNPHFNKRQCPLMQMQIVPYFASLI